MQIFQYMLPAIKKKKKRMGSYSYPFAEHNSTVMF